MGSTPLESNAAARLGSFECLEKVIKEMTNQLTSLIEAARNQLPEAFSAMERPPWPEGASEVVGYEPLPLPRDVGIDIPSRFSDETAGIEELEELEEELEENGFEALALYLSFHQPLAGGQWGIFMLGEPMWRLREKIRRDQCKPCLR